MEQNKEIIVAHRGWVFVGDVTEDLENIVISNALNIRRWGTTKGLGQLAIDGPQPNTVIDSYGTVKIHKLSVVCRIKVTAIW